MREDKKDRLGRMEKVEHLLYQSPEGLTVREIAHRCKVSPRTARRDLETLEQEIGVPIWQDKAKRGIEPGYFLPPISFTLPEAMAIFLAARLLLSYSNAYYPSIDSAFMKLNSAVKPPLRNQIAKTIGWMQKLNPDDRFRRVMDTLTNAWMKARKVKIWYQALGKTEAKERILSTYFIQPAAIEHATYVIGYCDNANTVLTFKVERINSVELLEERYEIPESFDANQYLGSAWGITVSGKAETIKLRFDPEVGRIAQETKWHPTQSTRMQPDGAAIVTFKLPITQEFISFILWWGEKVEVLEPEGLRREVKRVVEEMGRIYQK